MFEKLIPIGALVVTQCAVEGQPGKIMLHIAMQGQLQGLGESREGLQRAQDLLLDAAKILGPAILSAPAASEKAVVQIVPASALQQMKLGH